MHQAGVRPDRTYSRLRCRPAVKSSPVGNAAPAQVCECSVINVTQLAPFHQIASQDYTRIVPHVLQATSERWWSFAH